MRLFKRFLALLTVLTLVICCTVTGLVLPAAAEGNTFKLAKDELYLAPADGGYVVYAAVPPVTLDGKEYAETLTWTTSNSNVVAISDASTGLLKTVKDSTGTAVITATNAEGESHSCTVTVAWDGERISGGDFESVASATARWTTNIIKTNAGKIITEENGNHALEIPATMTTAGYYQTLTIKPSTKYVLSFDVKGDTGEINVVNTSSSHTTVFGSSKASYKTSGWQYITPKADTWTHYEFYIQTKSGANRNYIFGLGNQNITNGTNTNPVYIDNVSFYELGTAESISLSATETVMEIGDEATLSVTASPSGATFNRVQWSSNNEAVATVDKNGKITALSAGTATITAKSGILDAVTCTVTVYEELLAVIPDLGMENGKVSSDAVVGEVKAGDIVTVTVTPDEGYLMVPGSLKYVLDDGTEVSILNETLEPLPVWGRESVGNTFQFEMPEKKVTLVAEFISTAEQNFSANTIGTSCHYIVDENGEKVYDGIRFLTRLNLANKFDATADELFLTYGGVEYKVLELGSLLKREQNLTELNYKNAVENSSTVGVNRMWISKAYTADSGVFKLVDYTDSYIDFTSVMMTTHYDRFYTARGYIRMQAADASIITLEFDEITNSISSVVPILPPVQDLDGVTAEKESWTPLAHTVEPGQKIKYTINVTAGETAGTTTVFEPIPENTVYVDGADRLVGKTAVWEVDLDAGETKELTYTVQVKDSLDLCEGGTVVATDTQVGDTTFAADNTLYIERTVNKADEKYVNTAIKALMDSTYHDLTFVYWVYQVAFSSSYTGYHTEIVYNGFSAADLLQSVLFSDGSLAYSYIDASGKTISGTNQEKDNIAPTLYGGTMVKGPVEGLKGEPAAVVSESDLMIGDVVIVKNNNAVSVYMYCDNGLLDITSSGNVAKADITILDNLTASQAYVVVRPRTGLTSVTSSDVDKAPAEETYTEYQNALIKTAEAYLMRGQKVQYADSTFGWTGPTTVNGSYMEYRWRLREDAPEDATEQYYKYINCSSFCHDVYYFGLNYRLFNGYESFTCNQMVTNSSSSRANLREFYFTRATSDEHTDEEKQQIEEQFMSTIQPGDLLIILRGDAGTAHVMMYIGNGKMIHATGNAYRYGTNGQPPIENPEPAVRYNQVWDYFFRPTSSNYAFGENLTTLAIVRPLNDFNKAVPENTVNRIENLRGVVAQKLSSHRAANTVNRGDNVTFTFDIRNTNDEAKTLAITDTVPAGTTYVSGADTVNGDTLGWTVTVPADGSVTVSYTVRVNDDTSNGTTLQTVATVGGVKLDCPAVTVGDTLTAEQQAALRDAVAAIKEEGTTLTNIELVNAIYERAGLDCTFGETDLATIMTGERGVFKEISEKANCYTLATATEDTVYRNMLVPTLYGGNNVFSPRWQHDRTRLAYESDLAVGDLIITRDAGMYEFFMYTGDDVMFSLTNAKDDTISANVRMEQLLGRRRADYYRRYFAVLRPSLTNGSEPVGVTE